MGNVNGIFLQAVTLPENDLLIVKYEISSNNIGRIQLSNDIKLFTKKQQDKLKAVLKFIEEYSTESFVIPKQNSHA
jgi:hypothetical protein